MKPYVLISVPTYDGQVHHGFVMAVMEALSKSRQTGIQFVQSSLLAKCFNQLWCAALNRRAQGITHFLMMHADIAVRSENWVDRMLQLMTEHQADILSAVSPMKSSDGLTSCGIETGDPFRVKRYTLTEIHDGRPKTFTHEKLVVNTGLMLVDITKPWVELVKFTIEDEILCRDGVYEARSLSEDWGFSRQARAQGAKLFVTSEIVLEHMGTQSYPNAMAWGNLKEDKV